MSDRDIRRITGGMGIVFVVLLLIAFAIGGKPPAFTDSAAKVAKHVSEKRDGIQVGGLLVTAALAFFLFFLGTLVHRHRGAEGSAGGKLTAIAFGGGVVAVALAAVGTGMTLAAAAHVGKVNADTTRALWDLQLYTYNMTFVGVAALVYASGILSLRYGSLPKWLGAASLLLGLFVLVVGAVGAVDDTGPFYTADGVLGLIGFLGFLLWTAVTAAVMVADPAK